LKGRNLIGPNLRRIRRAIRPKVTLDDLSARLALGGLQLNRATLSKIENQQRSVFDFEIVALAEALRVSPMELLKPTMVE
jgi:hypothetical protein